MTAVRKARGLAIGRRNLRLGLAQARRPGSEAAGKPHHIREHPTETSVSTNSLKAISFCGRRENFENDSRRYRTTFVPGADGGLLDYAGSPEPHTGRASCFVILFATALVLADSPAFAEIIASDNAGNYTTTWRTGDNKGTGFKPWQLTDTFARPPISFAIQSSTKNDVVPLPTDTGHDGDIDTNAQGQTGSSGKAFELEAFPVGPAGQAAQVVTAVRPFQNALLKGQQFFIDVDNGAFKNVNGTQGSFSISLTSGGQNRLTIQARPLLPTRGTREDLGMYVIQDSAGSTLTNIPLTNQGVRIAVTLTDTDKYSVTFGSGTFRGMPTGIPTSTDDRNVMGGMTANGDNIPAFPTALATRSTWTGTLSGPAGGKIDSVKVVDNGSGATSTPNPPDGRYTQYFNSIKIETPDRPGNPMNRAKSDGRSVHFDAVSQAMTFSNDAITDTGFPGDPIVGANINVPSLTLSGESADGSFIFAADGTTHFTVVKGSNIYLQADLPLLFYLPAENLFYGELVDASFATLGSPWVSEMSDLFDPTVANFDQALDLWFTFNPDEDFFSLTNSFSMSNESSGSNGIFAAEPLPEPATIWVFILGVIATVRVWTGARGCSHADFCN
jgi:hypothetical protein